MPQKTPMPAPMTLAIVGLFLHGPARPFQSGDLPADLLPILLAGDLFEDFADREQADHDEDDRHAGEKVGIAIGETADAADGIGADGGDHQADQRREQALEQRAFGHRDDDAEAENAEREIGGGAERQCELRQRSGQKDDAEDADEIADRAGLQRNAERFSGLALLLHLVAVDHGRGGGVGAGRADQDGGNGAAIFGADIGRRQQHQGRDRVHGVGERQQQRHGDRRRQAGHGAAENAPGHAEDGHRHDERRSQKFETGDNGVHGRASEQIRPDARGMRTLEKERENQPQHDRAAGGDRDEAKAGRTP